GLKLCNPDDVSAVKNWLANLGLRTNSVPNAKNYQNKSDAELIEFAKENAGTHSELAEEFRNLPPLAKNVITSDRRIAAHLAILLKSVEEKTEGLIEELKVQDQFRFE